MLIQSLVADREQTDTYNSLGEMGGDGGRLPGEFALIVTLEMR